MALSERKKMERCLGILTDMLDREIVQAHNRDSARYMYGQVVGALGLARTLGIIDEEEEILRFHEVQKKFYYAF